MDYGCSYCIIYTFNFFYGTIIASSVCARYHTLSADLCILFDLENSLSILRAFSDCEIGDMPTLTISRSSIFCFDPALASREKALRYRLKQLYCFVIFIKRLEAGFVNKFFSERWIDRFFVRI